MINNTKFYLIDGFAETLTGGKSKKDFYGEASNTSDDEKGGNYGLMNLEKQRMKVHTFRL